ncbi:hypothetical protein HDU67_009159, partial [Dinochytrium kinnereticum]
MSGNRWKMIAARSHSRQGSVGGGFGESIGWQTPPPRHSRQSSIVQKERAEGSDEEEGFSLDMDAQNPVVAASEGETPPRGHKLERLQTDAVAVDSTTNDDQMSSSSHTTSSGATTLKRLSTGDEDSLYPPSTSTNDKTPTLSTKLALDGDQPPVELAFLLTLANDLTSMLIDHRTDPHQGGGVAFPQEGPTSAFFGAVPTSAISPVEPQASNLSDPATPLTAVPAPGTMPLPSTRHSLMQKVTNATSQIRNELVRTRDLDKRIQETEKRLRARDEYLQNTIMDTARRVQELEQLTADLGSRNEELESELMELRRDKNALESELVDLEEDHMALQNEIVAGEVVGALAVPATSSASKDGMVGSAVELVGVGEIMDHNILDDYVLLRDIDTQTDDELWLHAALTHGPPSATATAAARARSVSAGSGTSSASAFSLENYISSSPVPQPTTPPPTPVVATASKQERRLLSLSSKLSYASLIASTQSETISELEQLLARREAEVERLTATVAELGFRAEHVGAVGGARDRVVEELVRRIQGLEAERSGWQLGRRSLVMGKEEAVAAGAPATVGERPLSLQFTATPASPSSVTSAASAQTVLLHQQHQIPAAASPSATPVSLQPSTQRLANRLMGLEELYMSTMGSYPPAAVGPAPPEDPSWQAARAASPQRASMILPPTPTLAQRPLMNSGKRSSTPLDGADHIGPFPFVPPPASATVAALISPSSLPSSIGLGGNPFRMSVMGAMPPQPFRLPLPTSPTSLPPQDPLPQPPHHQPISITPRSSAPTSSLPPTSMRPVSLLPANAAHPPAPRGPPPSAPLPPRPMEMGRSATVVAGRNGTVNAATGVKRSSSLAHSATLRGDAGTAAALMYFQQQLPG